MTTLFIKQKLHALAGATTAAHPGALAFESPFSSFLSHVFSDQRFCCFLVIHVHLSTKSLTLCRQTHQTMRGGKGREEREVCGKITFSHSDHERVVASHISLSRSRSDHHDLTCWLKARRGKHSHVTCRTPCTVIAATSNARHWARTKGEKVAEGGRRRREGEGGERRGRRKVSQLLVPTSASMTSST